MKADEFCAESHRVEFARAPVNNAPSFELALHTAAPKGGDQRSNELAAAGYDRVTVLRNDLNWAVSGRTVMNNVKIRFPTITSGDGTVTHLSIGIGGRVRRVVELSEAIVVRANRFIEFEPGDIAITE